MKLNRIFYILIFLLLSFSSFAFAAEQPSVIYMAHSSDIGWQPAVENGADAGTTGMAKSLEAIRITSRNLPGVNPISYQAHCSNIGWQGWKSNNETAGTEGQALKLQAVQIKLNDESAQLYDIYYRMHTANIGWLDWAKNGETAGTTGLDLPGEALEVVVVPKDSAAPGETTRPNYTREFVQNNQQIQYVSYVANTGWQTPVSNGSTTGTLGEAKAIEGINVTLPTFANGGVQYQAHVSNVGWQGWVRDGETAGLPGSGNALEAFQAELYGEAALLYDIYYQAHVEDYGWLGWAKNGAYAGTTNGGRRLEALNIVILPKGSNAPGTTDFAYRKTYPKNVADPVVGRCIYVPTRYQALYLYDENSQLVYHTDVTTGTAGTASETPRGRFNITSKQREVYISGADYYTLVHYWIPFIGKMYGIHDADGWRQNYGGDFWLTKGSGGCINVPYKNLTELFGLIRVGDPIIID